MCTRKGYAASVSQLRWQRLRYIFPFSNRRLGAKDPLPSRRRFIQSFPKDVQYTSRTQPAHSAICYVGVSAVYAKIAAGPAAISATKEERKNEKD